MKESILVHATAIAIGGGAVLLRGPSGSGKSDLALRLIDGGACLIADDQAELRREANGVMVTCPAAIAGLLEVRGLGILRLDAVAEAPLRLCVDLVPPGVVERLPDRSFVEFFALPVPRIALAASEVSAAAKIRLASRAFSAESLPVILPT